MTYRDTLEYLYKQIPMYHLIGAAAYKADLENTITISRHLGNPESRFKSVHVAGTNGKGSTSHFLASILQEAGYKTGLFTSPHLKDFRERIRVNGRMIPKSEVTQFLIEYQATFNTIKPSFFEWTFGLASHYFANQAVDIAILETGMGGRLDSTNIIIPLVSVITNISFDHMQFLGDTLEKIASEKAEIIKPGIPVVIGETQAGPQEVLMAKAKECSSPIFFADQNYSAIVLMASGREISTLNVEVTEKTSNETSRYTSPLPGHYQLKNLCTVLQTIEVLSNKGFTITPGNVSKGIRYVIRNTGLQGRWQTISQNPLTIADIAHNMEGISEVVRQIRLTPHKQLHFVFGVVNDKDVDSMLRLLPADAIYYFCKAAIPRGLDASELLKKAVKTGLKGREFLGVSEALNAARAAASLDDLVVVGGSAFVVAEVI